MPKNSTAPKCKVRTCRFPMPLYRTMVRMAEYRGVNVMQAIMQAVRREIKVYGRQVQREKKGQRQTA